jgi:hypothetical protein
VYSTSRDVGAGESVFRLCPVCFDRSEFDLQIAEKKRREAEEKAAKRAEDTHEEKKALNYLSTQAAKLETRAMNLGNGNGFVQATDTVGGTSPVVPGTRPNFVNLARLEQQRLGLDEESRDGSTGLGRGDSFGSIFSGPLGPTGSLNHATNSNSFSSLGAGDTKAHERHLAALQTSLGTDFIDDSPLRGPVNPGKRYPQRAGAQISPQPQVPGASGAPTAPTALPDLLRDMQESRMRLKAQFAEQLEEYGPEGSQNRNVRLEAPQKRAEEERMAAAEQLAHVEVWMKTRQPVNVTFFCCAMHSGTPNTSSHLFQLC